MFAHFRCILAAPAQLISASARQALRPFLGIFYVLYISSLLGRQDYLSSSGVRGHFGLSGCWVIIAPVSAARHGRGLLGFVSAVAMRALNRSGGANTRAMVHLANWVEIGVS